MSDILIDILKVQKIDIGYSGEYDVRKVEIDLKPWIAQFGSGQAVLIFVRHMGSAPEIVPTSEQDDVLTWIPGMKDLMSSGWGKLELRWYPASGGMAKSKTVSVKINPSIMEEGEPPEGYKDWLETLTELDAHATAKLQEVLTLSGYVEKLYDDTITAAERAAASAASASDSASDAAMEKSAAERYGNAAETARSAAESAANEANHSKIKAKESEERAIAAKNAAEAARDASNQNVSSASASASRSSTAAADAAQSERAAKDALTEVKKAAMTIETVKDEALTDINKNANVQRITDLEGEVISLENTALKSIPKATNTAYGGIKAYNSYDGDGDNALARINAEGFMKYHRTTDDEISNAINRSQLKADVDTLKKTALTSIPKADGNNFGGVKASAQQDDHNGTVTISNNGYLKYHRTTDAEIKSASKFLDLESSKVATPQMFESLKNGDDWTYAFEAMFDDSTYCDYYIPRGTYKLTRPITLNKRCNISMSRLATLNFIFGNSSGANHCIRFDTSADYSKIEGGTVKHDSADAKSITTIIDVNAFNVSISELTVRGSADVNKSDDVPVKVSDSKEASGVRINSNKGAECRIYGCKIKGTTVGLLVENVDLFIENTYIEGCTGSGLRAVAGAIDAYHVHSYLNMGHGFIFNSAESCNFNNCYADTNAGDGYHLEGSSNHPNTFVACRSYKNRGQFGYYVKDQTYCTFYSCRSEEEAVTLNSWAFRATTGKTNNVNMIGCFNDSRSRNLSIGADGGTINIRGMLNAGPGMDRVNNLV